MNQRMIFTVDRHSVNEGDIVEVRWDCYGAQDVKLTIDNGYKASTIPLGIEGAKKFRLNRSKGLTRLTIAAVVDGKIFRKKLRVRVKKLKAVKAETVDDRGRTMNGFRRFWQKTMTKWRSFRASSRLAYQQMPASKQLAVKTLAIVVMVALLALYFPKFYPLGLLLVAFYLCWVIVKK